MYPDGLVSLAITHFFEFISAEKLFENFKISRNVKSFPKIPLIPDTDIFNISNLDTLFIKLWEEMFSASIAQPGRANAS